MDTKYPGTPAYESHIGVMRILFGIQEDPIAITTLLSDDKTELWVSQEVNKWERLFG